MNALWEKLWVDSILVGGVLFLLLKSGLKQGDLKGRTSSIRNKIIQFHDPISRFVLWLTRFYVGV